MAELSKSLEVVRTMKQVMDSMRHNIGRMYKNMNLTGPQGMLMGMLAHHGEMKISDLSEKLDLSNNTVSGILDRLEKQGMVVRTRSDEDRRVVYVNITPEFKKTSEQFFMEVEKSIEAKMSKADSEELDRILEGLNTLKKLLE